MLFILFTALVLFGSLAGLRVVWRGGRGPALKILLTGAVLAFALFAWWVGLVIAYYAGGGH